MHQYQYEAKELKNFCHLKSPWDEIIIQREEIDAFLLVIEIHNLVCVSDREGCYLAVILDVFIGVNA